MHREAPPGFGRPSLAQLIQCDEAAFSRLATTLTSIRQRDDGSYPLGEALLQLRCDPLVALHLAPTAKSAQTQSPGGPSSSWRSQPYNTGSPQQKGKGNHGKGSWKRKVSSCSTRTQREMAQDWVRRPNMFWVQLQEWLLRQICETRAAVLERVPRVR